MSKIILLLITFVVLSLSKTVQVNIVADKFFTNQENNITKFEGNVKMTKENDFLVCKELTINTTQDKDTNKTIAREYIAIGNVSYSFTNPKTTFKGKGDKVIYYPLESKYIVIGHGYLEDTGNGRVLIGDKIHLDNLTGNAQIEGKENQPVKLTFTVDTKDKNETH